MFATNYGAMTIRIWVIISVLFFLILPGYFAGAQSFCFSLFDVSEISSVDVKSPQAQDLLRKSGLNFEEARGLTRYAAFKASVVFVRFRNPKAQFFDGQIGYMPKSRDIPFKSDPSTGIVFAQDRETFFSKTGNTLFNLSHWLRWQEALHSHKYYVDTLNHIHVGAPTGPEVYSDIDLFAVVKTHKGHGKVEPVLFGNGIYINQNALDEINSFVSVNMPYALIRHGSLIEYVSADRIFKENEELLGFTPEQKIFKTNAIRALGYLH